MKNFIITSGMTTLFLESPAIFLAHEALNRRVRNASNVSVTQPHLVYFNNKGYKAFWDKVIL